jgi:RNA polymerase sigma factor (sigma-70 family)
LLERFIASGDGAAFAALVRRHGPMVFRVCRRVLNDRHEAEDAFQATFLVLARRAPAVARRELLANWLHGIARRTALRARAQAARLRRPQKPWSPEPPQPPVEAAARELAALLDDEIRRLPEDYRVAFLLCHVEGQTRDQAARRLGWSLRTLERRLEQGRNLLRQRLARRGVTLSAALVAAELVEPARAAALPARLAEATAAGAASPRAAALADAALRGMVAEWVRPLAVLAAALAVLGAVVGLAAPPENAPPAALPPPPAQTAAAPEGPRHDRHGDPLPDGAVVRLGTVRFRHADGVTCSVFGPDGKTLVTGSHDGTARLWDAATGKELRRFAGHHSAVRHVALSPNAKLLAAAEDRASEEHPGQVCVWDVATGKERARWSGPKEGIGCLAWAADNRTLGVGGRDGSVRLHQPGAAAPTATFAWHKREVHCLVFSPDATICVSCGGDGLIAMTDLRQPGQPLLLRGQEKEFHFVAFAPGGKTLISGGDCYGDEISCKVASVNTIAVWDVASGKRLREFSVGTTAPTASYHEARNAALEALLTVTGQVAPRHRRDYLRTRSWALSADAGTLALGYPDHTVHLWDVAAGKPLRRLDGFTDRTYPPMHLAFAPDGKTLAAAGSHHTPCLLDTATGKPVATREPAHVGDIRAVALSPDGKVAATGGHDQILLLWDARTGQPLRTLEGHQDWVCAAAFAPDGKTMASADIGGSVRVWDAASGKLLWEQPTDEVLQYVMGQPRLAFAPDGKILAATVCGRVRLWDAATGAQRGWFDVPATLMSGTLRFSADGQQLLAAGDYGAVCRWRVATGEKTADLRLPADTGTSIAFAPSGTQAAALGFDGWLRFWELDAGRQLFAVRKKESMFYRLAASEDGRYVAVCEARSGGPGQGDGPSIEVVEAVSGQTLATFRLPPQTGVCVAAFAADGRRLITGLADTTTLIWDLDPPLPKKEAAPAALWADLGKSGPEAWRAMAALAARPAAGVALLREQLRPATLDRQRVLQLIAALDSDRFSVRQEATAKLKQFGPEARVVFREVLARKPTLEVRKRLELLEAALLLPVTSAEVLRQVRAVAVLERLGTPEARELLEALAAGAAEAWLTREAAAALRRLAP